MELSAQSMGHAITTVNGVWIYVDTGLPFPEPGEPPDRACAYCKLDATYCDDCNDWHDPCLGHLPNVAHACCGHGVERGYVVSEYIQSRKSERNER